MRPGVSEGARILSVDLGSSAVRAEFYDGSGTLEEGTEARLDYELEYTSDGGVAVDADELLDLVVRAIDGALERVGDAMVSGVAMSTFWHSVLGLDRDGRPTTPVLYWADRRAADAARELRERLDEAAVHRRTGCVLHSSYWPAKLLWLSHENPDAFARTPRSSREPSAGSPRATTSTRDSLETRTWGPRWPPRPGSSTRTSGAGTKRW